MNVSEAQPMTDIQLAPGGDLAPGLLCPECKGFVTTLTVAGNSTHPCSRCGFAVRCDEGVWRMLSSGLSARFSQFIAEYQAVRQAEARGASDAAYYLALPFNDLNGTHTAQWRIRASTFRHLQRKVLAPMAARFHRPLNILDLGAGNGWLSYRLSLLGHQAVAVDLLTNTTDGLGAASHYSAHLPSMFARVQASVDDLPFADGTFDLAIFNASFHYSENYEKTIAEALRCTRSAGAVVIADTPWYPDKIAGEQMVREKHDRFRTLYGFASNSLDHSEYLTPDRLRALSTALHLRWSVMKPFYGLRWALRPLQAALRRRRTPSRFYLFVAERRT